MTSLLKPSLDHYDAWAECVRDYERFEDMNGSGWWWLEDFGPDLDSCRRMVAKARELAVAPPEGLVVSDCYWVAEQAAVIGFLMVRHSLDNEFLRTQGGHIGYSIRPSYRRQGHASRALGLALDRARELGLDRVLLTCLLDNLASARTIESQGGVFESVYDDKRRYWITLK
ncbi:GNAT family N-acetyltransferase [Nocardioides sp.]|uniref:GNAT family N-acetyltransferase n=1 Tax=Nocardioides sp. TaxID=35761 RepID=UPI0039E43621